MDSPKTKKSNFRKHIPSKHKNKNKNQNKNQSKRKLNINNTNLRFAVCQSTDIENADMDTTILIDILKKRDGNWRLNNFNNDYVHFAWGEPNVTPVGDSRKRWANFNARYAEIKNFLGQGKHAVANKFRLYETLQQIAGSEQIAIPKTRPLTEVTKLKKGEVLFVKDAGACAQEGVVVVATQAQLNKVKADPKFAKNSIASDTVKNPQLWKTEDGNLKFHLRNYLLVAVEQGIARAYLNEDWWRVLTASKPYTEDNWNDPDIHLTGGKRTKDNYNWKSGIAPEHTGQSAEWVAKAEESVRTILRMVARAVALSAAPYPESNNAYEIFGTDIVVDTNATAWLIEVNTRAGYSILRPALNTKVSHIMYNWQLDTIVLPHFGLAPRPSPLWAGEAKSAIGPLTPYANLFAPEGGNLHIVANNSNIFNKQDAYDIKNWDVIFHGAKLTDANIPDIIQPVNILIQITTDAHKMKHGNIPLQWKINKNKYKKHGQHETQKQKGQLGGGYKPLTYYTCCIDSPKPNEADMNPERLKMKLKSLGWQMGKYGAPVNFAWGEPAINRDDMIAQSKWRTFGRQPCALKNYLGQGKTVISNKAKLPITLSGADFLPRARPLAEVKSVKDGEVLFLKNEKTSGQVGIKIVKNTDELETAKKSSLFDGAEGVAVDAVLNLATWHDPPDSAGVKYHLRNYTLVSIEGGISRIYVNMSYWRVMTAKKPYIDSNWDDPDIHLSGAKRSKRDYNWMVDAINHTHQSPEWIAKAEQSVINILVSFGKAVATHAAPYSECKSGYEVFGSDIVVDANAKAWLIEVNTRVGYSSKSISAIQYISDEMYKWQLASVVLPHFGLAPRPSPLWAGEAKSAIGILTPYVELFTPEGGNLHLIPNNKHIASSDTYIWSVSHYGNIIGTINRYGKHNLNGLVAQATEALLKATLSAITYPMNDLNTRKHVKKSKKQIRK
jgi:hypothetical protein